MPTRPRNAEIAAVLDEIADILEIEAANPFRVRAYRNAARLVAGLGEDITGLLGRGEDLTRLKGIGRDLASKITEIATTGRSTVLEKLHREVPEAVTELLRNFTILAHPTGRLLAEREPYDVDMSQIIRCARERGCFLELNAHPERLDLLDVYCREAKRAAVLVSINSDAHSIHDFSVLDWGIGQARRGWLEAEDVLNTQPLPDLRGLLARTM